MIKHLLQSPSFNFFEDFLYFDVVIQLLIDFPGVMENVVDRKVYLAWFMLRLAIDFAKLVDVLLSSCILVVFKDFFIFQKQFFENDSQSIEVELLIENVFKSDTRMIDSSQRSFWISLLLGFFIVIQNFNSLTGKISSWLDLRSSQSQ